MLERRSRSHILKPYATSSPVVIAGHPNYPSPRLDSSICCRIYEGVNQRVNGSSRNEMDVPILL
jgi:hypothetical protein